MNDERIDVVGIGAINVDYIVPLDVLSHLGAVQQEGVGARFEYGNEQPASTEEIAELLQDIGRTQCDVFLGGSALLCVQSLAALKCGLNLGYVGVCGRVTAHGVDFAAWCQRNRIDDRWVRRPPDLEPGICVSYTLNQERSLRTTPNANVLMAQHLTENFDAIVEYLALAKIVHVTSFLDDETPPVLFRMLTEVKARNPWVRICLDPGYCWVRSQDPSVHGMLKLCDHLFLNCREFEQLGNEKGRPISEMRVAENIMRRCEDMTSILAVMEYNRVCLYHKFADKLIAQPFHNLTFQAGRVQDATGAGDVFAAGFMTALLIPGLSMADGVELGLRLARTKLLAAGTRLYERFPGVMVDFIEEATKKIATVPEATAAETPVVFVGHGGSRLWQKVEQHLQPLVRARAGEVVAWESRSRVSQHVVSVLGELLAKCNFAVLVLTPEDATAEGDVRARQNVIHEVGLFQGRLGFNKVVLLCEETTEIPSNVHGLLTIRFSGTNIESTFNELDRVLGQERVIL